MANCITDGDQPSAKRPRITVPAFYGFRYGIDNKTASQKSNQVYPEDEDEGNCIDPQKSGREFVYENPFESLPRHIMNLKPDHRLMHFVELKDIYETLMKLPKWNPDSDHLCVNKIIVAFVLGLVRRLDKTGVKVGEFDLWLLFQQISPATLDSAGPLIKPINKAWNDRFYLGSVILH